MLDILLIGKNTKYCIKLINEVNNASENVRFVGIVNNVKNLKDEIKRKHIDIILIYLNTSQIEKILNLKEINAKITPKSIILILDELKLKKELKENKLIYDYILKDNCFKKVLNIIDKLVMDRTNIEKKHITMEEDILFERIKTELDYLGYSFSHIGTKYIAEAIYILFSLDNYYNYDLENDIYPIIANKYHKTVNSVKCSITYATDQMYFNCDETILLSYLKEDYSIKPGSKKMMFSIIENIKFNKI